jgi:hypothetical protein
MAVSSCKEEEVQVTPPALNGDSKRRAIQRQNLIKSLSQCQTLIRLYNLAPNPFTFLLKTLLLLILIFEFLIRFTHSK